MNNIISNLRLFRINIETPNVLFNRYGYGISLFDLIGTFIIAYMLENFILQKIKIQKKTYYLSLIPIAILSHLLVNQDTFLNKSLYTKSLNIYHIILFIIIFNLFL